MGTQGTAAGLTGETRAPLAGIRIVDLTTVMLGPYCTRILAAYGADVVKVESLAGDDARHIGPARSDGMGGNFLTLNTGKRSLAVDLKTGRGRAALLEVVREADVFVHSMRPGAIRRLGLTSGDVATVNDRLLYCTVNGFDPAGPDAGKPAYDDIIQAGAGLAAIQGRLLDSDPQFMATVLADKTAGLMALSAILAGLFERERSGRGQAIDLAMYDLLVSFVLAEQMYAATFEPPLAPSVYPRSVSSHRRPHATLDGFIAVMPYHDRHWQAFFAAAGEPKLARDPRFSSMGERTHNVDELYATVARLLRTRTTDDWLAALEAADVPCTSVKTIDDLLSSSDLRERNVIATKDHPTEGPVRVVNVPVGFSRTPVLEGPLAPRLGQHSREVLGEAGVCEESIDELVRAGIVLDGAPSAAQSSADAGRGSVAGPA